MRHSFRFLKQNFSLNWYPSSFYVSIHWGCFLFEFVLHNLFIKTCLFLVSFFVEIFLHMSHLRNFCWWTVVSVLLSLHWGDPCCCVLYLLYMTFFFLSAAFALVWCDVYEVLINYLFKVWKWSSFHFLRKVILSVPSPPVLASIWA